MRDIVQRNALARLELDDVEYEAGILDVIAEGAGELAEESLDAGRTVNDERLCARLRLTVLQGEEECGDITDVIGVEVRDAEMCELGPGQTEASEVMYDAGSTIEQDAAGPNS